MARTLFSFPTPFTPPTTEEDRLSWLRLIRSRRVGVSTFFRLMGEHGSAPAALDALPVIARAAGIDGYRPADAGAVRAELDAASAAGARMLCFGEAGYPAGLASIADPPPVLWCIGDTGLLGRPMVAMVGARNASSLGVRMARRLAAGLGGAGFCVVSGLARGIDAAAHAAALDTGTIAVMAGGVDVIYPVENTALAHSLAERGLLISEAPMGMAPIARHFPARNRIVSGLARAVLVVEAAARSGSLITARDALDQGREVMAVPGHPFDARAAGCNMLIRDGATLIRSTGDVLDALPSEGAESAANDSPGSPAGPGAAGGGERPVAAPTHGRAGPTRAHRQPGEKPPDRPTRPRRPMPQAPHPPAPQGAGPETTAPAGSSTRSLHREILQRLGPSPLAEDQLIRDLGLPAARVAIELLTLEFEGKVQRQPGGLVCLSAAACSSPA